MIDRIIRVLVITILILLSTVCWFVTVASQHNQYRHLALCSLSFDRSHYEIGFEIYLGKGRMKLGKWTYSDPQNAPIGRGDWNFADVNYSNSTSNDANLQKVIHRVKIAVPTRIIAALGLIFSAYPLVVLIRGPVNRWHRKRHGLCIGCGYDMRGNPTAICSECGLSTGINSNRNVQDT